MLPFVYIRIPNPNWKFPLLSLISGFPFPSVRIPRDESPNVNFYKNILININPLWHIMDYNLWRVPHSLFRPASANWLTNLKMLLFNLVEKKSKFDQFNNFFSLRHEKKTQFDIDPTSVGRLLMLVIGSTSNSLRFFSLSSFCRKSTSDDSVTKAVTCKLFSFSLLFRLLLFRPPLCKSLIH